MRKLANVIDLHEYKIRAALRELEQGRAMAEAAQAVLAEAAAESDHTPLREFGMCPCAYCVRFAADLPCSNYPACTCCGRPVQPRKVTRKARKVRKAGSGANKKRASSGRPDAPEEK